MKIESIEDGYKIFLYNSYFESANWHEKLEVEETLRIILDKIGNNYKINLRGFYRIKIYPQEIGTFIEILKIDDESYDMNEIDFRIMVIFNKDIYLKTENVELFLKYDKYYSDSYYYISLSDIDDFLIISEFGELVYSDEIDFEDGIFIKGI